MRKWIGIFYGLVVYLTTANLIFVYTHQNFKVESKILLTLVSIVLYFLYQFVPYWKKGIGARLNTLMCGYELMMTVCIGVTMQAVILVKRLLDGLGTRDEIVVFVASFILAFAMGFIMAMNGFVRSMFTARQVKLVWRILWWICWWVPVVNLIFSIYICHLVSRECKIEVVKQELNEVRKENEICATKYPVLLVHGVFFRDWQYFNYWGRIPAELQRNGCKVYYGRHQSAAAVKTRTDSETFI